MTLAVSIAQSGANNVTMRNRVINGQMQIDQRNAGASVTVNTWVVFPVDRFFGSFRPSTGVATAQQVTDAPAGFTNSVRLTQSSVTSQAASDVYSLVHSIEGNNIADMNFGSANARPFTLSFWVKSSVTGTYSVSLQNNSPRRSYVTTYTINSANTWEQKTITVAGDTSGTWDTGNTIGLSISWGLGSGSDYQTSTLNAWQTNNVLQATGATRWIGTSGATFQITGVQLEEGTTATAFEQRLYGTELALCCRYWQQFPNAVSSSSGASAIPMWCSSATNASTRIYLPTVMRTNPSVSYAGTLATSGATGTIGVYYAGAFRTWSSFSVNETTAESFRADAASSSSFAAGGAAGLYFYTSTQTDVRIMLSAEL
jgi:hypothetical protein